MDVALAGFLTGLSLIVAIGAQNAYVLRLGLARNHVGVAVVICAGATVRDAYVGPYSAISEDALVERAEIELAILLERSSIVGIDTRIEDSLIGADCEIRRSDAIRSANRLLVGDGSRIEIL